MKPILAYGSIGFALGFLVAILLPGRYQTSATSAAGWPVVHKYDRLTGESEWELMQLPKPKSDGGFQEVEMPNGAILVFPREMSEDAMEKGARSYWQKHGTNAINR